MKKKNNIKIAIVSSSFRKEGIDTSQLNEIIEEAKKVISKLDLSNKYQVIRDIIDRCIVKGGNTVEVQGHLPLFAVNMGYEPISRDRHFTVPSLEFRFTFIAPKPRKERIILVRDEMGRIVSSKTPQIHV